MQNLSFLLLLIQKLDGIGGKLDRRRKMKKRKLFLIQELERAYPKDF